MPHPIENTYRGYKFGEEFMFKEIYLKSNYSLTADDSIYISNIRPNEKLRVGKIYTDKFEYLDYNDEGDDLSITIVKDSKVYTLIANGLWDIIVSDNPHFNTGNLVEVQWKIDFLTPAGDSEALWVVKFAEKITKINEK